MYCSYCSAYNNDKATYCTTCGRELSFSSSESWGDFETVDVLEDNSAALADTKPPRGNRGLWILLGTLGLAVIVLAVLLLVRFLPAPDNGPVPDSPSVSDQGAAPADASSASGSQGSGSIPGPALPRVTPPPGGGNLAAAVPSSAGIQPI